MENSAEHVDYVYRFKDGRLTVQKIVWTHSRNRRSAPHPLPVPIDDSLSPSECRVFAMLLHWLRDTAQARALVRPIFAIFPKKMSASSWTIDAGELAEAVIMAFVEGKKAVSGEADVEYLGGQRRDTVRALMA